MDEEDTQVTVPLRREQVLKAITPAEAPAPAPPVDAPAAQAPAEDTRSHDSFFPKQRPRRDRAKLLDPFAPLPMPRGAPAGRPLAPILEDEPVPPPAAPPAADTPPAAPASAPLHTAPTVEIAAPAELRRPDWLPPAEAELPAPSRRGPPSWAVFGGAFLGTVALALGLGWAFRDRLGLGGAAPVSLSAAPGASAPAEGASAPAAAAAAPPAEAQDPCKDLGFWSQPDVRFNRFRFELVGGRTVEATVTGLTQCELEVRLADGAQHTFPLGDIVSSERR